MAEKIGGLIVKIGADTTQMANAIKESEREAKGLQSELKKVEQALKLDPSNTVLLTQKQELLTKSVENTRSKLEAMQAVQDKMARAHAANPEWERQYAPLQKSIEQTTSKLKRLSLQQEQVERDFKSGKISADEYEKFQTTLQKTTEKSKQLAQQKKELDASFQDGHINDEEYRRFQRELQTTATELKNLTDEQEALEQSLQGDEIKDEVREHQQFQQALHNTSGELKNNEKALEQNKAKLEEFLSVNEKIGTAAKTIGNALLPVTAAVTGLGAAAVTAGASFDSAMSQVAAVSGATGKELEALRSKAMEMGESTKFSASESAEALNYMAMAGWKTGEMLGGLEGVMDLAAASGTDLATTSDIVTDALTAFGMKAEESSHFADVLAAASSNANTNVVMMGESFRYVAPLAGAMKYSAEDVGLALGLMANAGVKASQAGTSLRAALSSLIKPSGDSTYAAMKRLGLIVDDVNVAMVNSDGSAKSLSETLRILRSAFSDLTETEKSAAAAQIFGREAMSGMLAIINTAPDDFAKLENAIYNCDGASRQMADTMIDNLAGDVTLLKSQLEGVGIQISDLMVPALRKGAEGVSEFLTKFSQLSPETQKTILAIAATVAALGPLAKGIQGVSKAVPDMLKTVSALKESAGILKQSFQAIHFNPYVVGIGAVAAAIAGVVLVIDACNTSVAEQWEAMRKAGEAYQEAKQEADSLAGELKTIEEQIDKLNEKERLTFSEEGELENLQAISKELKMQLELANSKAVRAAQTLAEETVKTYQKTFAGIEISVDAIQAKIDEYNSREGGWLARGEDKYDVIGYLAQLKESRVKLAEAIASGDREMAAILRNNLDDATLALEEMLEELMEQKQRLSEVPLELITPEQQAAMEAIEINIQGIYSQLYEHDWKELKFSEILGQQDIQNAVNALKELAKEGKITAETFDDPVFSVIRKRLEDVGISAEDAAGQFLALEEQNKQTGGSVNDLGDALDQSGESLQNAAGEIDTLANALSDLSHGFDLLTEVQETVSEGNRINASTLQALADQYPQMCEAIDKYAAGMINEQDLLAELSERYEADQYNYKLTVLNKMAYSEAFYQQSGLNDAEFINSMLDNYGVDISNCKTYAQTKLKIESQLLTKISSAWSKYYNVQSGAYTQEYERLKKLADGVGPRAEEAQKILTTMTMDVNRYQGAISAMNEISMDGIQAEFKEVEKTASSSLSRTAEKAKEAGKDYSEELARGISSKAFQVENSIDDICKSATDVVMEEADSFQSAGKLYVDAFTEGLNSKVSQSIEAVEEFVNLQVEALSNSDEENAKIYKDAGSALVKAYSAQLEENAAAAVEQVKSRLTELTEATQEQYNALLKQRDELISKWSGGKGLFTIETDKETGTSSVLYKNLSEQASMLEEYYDRLESLRDKGVSEGILSEIISMDTSDALLVMRDMSQQSIGQLEQFSQQFDEIQLRATERAAEYYQSEIEQLRTNFTEKFAGALSEMPQLIKDVGLNTADGFLEGVQSRMTNISGKGEEVSKSVLAAMKKALDIHSPSKETERIGVYLIEGMWQGMDEKAGWLQQRVEELCEKIIGGLDSFSGQSAGAASGLQNIAVAADALSNSYQNASISTESLLTAQQTLSGVAADVARTQKELSENGEISASTLEKLSKTYPELNGAIADYLTNGQNAGALMDELQETETRYTENRDTLIARRTEQNLQEYAELQNHYAKLQLEVASGNENITNYDLEQARKLAEEKGKVYTESGQTIAELYAESYKNTMTGKSSELVQSMEESETKMTEAAKRVAEHGGKASAESRTTGIVKTIREKQNELNQSARDAESQAVDSARQTAEQEAPEIGRATVGSAAQGVQNNRNILDSALQSSVTESIENTKSSGENSGRSLGDAIINGIRSALEFNPLLGVMGNLVDGLVNKARNDLEVNSPSKVFIRIGKAVPEGMAQGIKDEQEKALRALREMDQALPEQAASMQKLLRPEALRLPIPIQRQAVSSLSQPPSQNIQIEIRPENMIVREEADINRVASAIGEKCRQNMRRRGNGAIL